jgi:hypothetical protein
MPEKAARCKIMMRLRENTMTRRPSATKQFAEKIGSARLIAALKSAAPPKSEFFT